MPNSTPIEVCEQKSIQDISLSELAAMLKEEPCVLTVRGPDPVRDSDGVE